ncbi:MAG: PEP-CTERM sorting domain-containing protein [Phenylobacterium sp.]|uniref:PEPxxWA-CTERM sorting domain-containing protein n=1 Tax=Phenylobacterium sp. TaxID=1871053 RepID=UPI00121B2075|nr:PEPxxWA-CTERM sorting domain-containing protein [Phenylobacterium sp.]TAJ72527.1 MAG: PEP-CTERM sorting domain-containing protein [Phenylobacterium sp.]
MKTMFAAAAAVALLSVATSAGAVATDLSTWTREGTGGTWVLAGDNNSVTQTVNGAPTVFYSDFNAIGRSLSGTIRVNGSSDDDFIGFVVGFNPGELGGPSDFLLIDWKQLSQSFHGFAPVGLAVSQVTNGLADNAGAWAHNSLGVTELARGATLGSTGWADFTTYTFDIEYTATNLKVAVNGVTQFDLDGTFGDGRFGFYNYSQANVTYAGIEDRILPPTGGVPEPGAWVMMILGFGAAGTMIRRRAVIA